MADRETVNLSERMKVTVCLNPVHSATGPLGVVQGYELFAHMLNTNEDMMKMARMIAYDEGLPVVPNPGILSPQAFVDELFHDRFPNEYLGDGYSPWNSRMAALHAGCRRQRKYI